MAGLFLIHAPDPAAAAETLAAARAQFARHGFPDPEEIAFDGWRLLHAPHVIGGPENLLVEREDFVALGGQFVALVRRSGRTFLLTDFFGSFQIFHDAQMTFFSTSLLAAAGAVPRLRFDPQGVYELAFNVVPLGDDTVFRELKTLGPDRVVELTPEGVRLLPDRIERLPAEERVERQREALLGLVRPHVAHFGNRVHCPLSGGLDSRLVLAALRAEGCRPHVYVYGGPRSGDVRIAREIGEAMGFEVEWVDKEAGSVSPDEFPEIVERNFQQYDGLPNYGELFENGSNGAAQRARHAGGAMSVSGGCGEIYRNFFFLPDRPISAAAVARAFFARYAKGDATGLFDEAEFLRAIEDKILAALGRPGFRGRLPRAAVEQIYPRVRCRALFGREISLENRFGAYLMPFLEHRIVADAMTLPLGLKNAGAFEARLLAGIDPALARLPSVYGHDFAGPPSLRHRLGEWSTRVRPIALRRRSYALRRRLGPIADEHGGLLTPDYMGRVIDLDYPAMRRFFRVQRIADSGMMRRIANLEYLAARLGSRLSA
jgi:asparagine synthase (glutamine-hydrolysing)